MTLDIFEIIDIAKISGKTADQRIFVTKRTDMICQLFYTVYSYRTLISDLTRKFIFIMYAYIFILFYYNIKDSNCSFSQETKLSSLS